MKRNSTGTNYSANTFGFASLKAHTETMKSMSVCHLHDWQSLQSCCSSSSSFSRGSFSEKSSRPASTDLTAMIASGLPDAEVLQSWLDSFNCGCYAVLFLKAGYDVQTVSKMTPEDLTAIGISNPDHRKKIIYEVRRMNITNTWPCYRKDFPVSQWLDELGLFDYKAAFESQGCHTVDDVFVLSWEDLEDMGVEKLGHLKRLLAACKKLKDTKNGRRTMSSDEVCRYSELSNCCNLQTGRGGGGGGAVLQPSATDIRPYFCVGGSGAAAVGVGGGCGVNGGPQLQTFQSSPRKVPTTSGVSRLSIFQRMQANNGGACSTTAQQHLTGKARAIVHPVPSSVAKPIGKIYGSPRMGEDLKKRSEPDLRRGRFHNVGSVTKLSLAKCDYSGASDSCPTSPPASARSWDHGASACTGGGARRSVFRLSAHLDEIAERNGGCVAPSAPAPAPAPQFPVDELLPPPTPPSLRCEASIQQLRSIRRNPPTQTNILSDCSEILSRSDCFSSPLGSTTTNSSGSCSFLVDRSICSEDEIQADRKANTVGQFQFRKSENDLHRHFDTTVNNDEPGGSLDHIGSMLQNLTDELDALLHEPEAVCFLE